MTMPPGSRDTEARLVAALADTAHRNLSDATPPPSFRPDDSSGQPDERTGAWVVVVLAAAIVVAVIAALLLPDRTPHSAQPADGGPGTFVTLRARTEGLSAADLTKARQIIKARAAALGAEHPDVRIVGSDEITAFLPGVVADAVGDLGAVDALQVRPRVLPWYASPTPSPPQPSGRPAVVDPWKSLGFPPPKDAAAYYALSRPQQLAVQAVADQWNCKDLPPDRADEPIVTCDQDGNYRYLLGPVLAASSDVESEAPAANPDAIANKWELALTLNPAAVRRLDDYIAQFKTPRIAVTLDGVAIADALSANPLADRTFIATSFSEYDERTAFRLAQYLNAGPLPAPFDVVSIQRR
jgi:preprotein translocase subunit SecD